MKSTVRHSNPHPHPRPVNDEVTRDPKHPLATTVTGAPSHAAVHSLTRRPDLLGIHIQLILIHRLQCADRAVHGAAVAYSLHHIAGAGLALARQHQRVHRIMLWDTYPTHENVRH